MDARLRRLERQAAAGDYEAVEKLNRFRLREAVREQRLQLDVPCWVYGGLRHSFNRDLGAEDHTPWPVLALECTVCQTHKRLHGAATVRDRIYEGLEAGEIVTIRLTPHPIGSSPRQWKICPDRLPQAY